MSSIPSREFRVTPVIKDGYRAWRVDELGLPCGSTFCFYATTLVDAEEMMEHIRQEPKYYGGNRI